MKENFKRNKTLTFMFLYYLAYFVYLAFEGNMVFLGYVSLLIPIILMLLVLTPKLRKFCLKIKKLYLPVVIIYVILGLSSNFYNGSFLFSKYVLIDLIFDTLYYLFIFGVIFDEIKKVEPEVNVKNKALDIKNDLNEQKQKKLEEYEDLLARNVLSESEFNELKEDLLKNK